MLRVWLRWVGVCGLFVFVACGTAKKTNVLQNPQAMVITPVQSIEQAIVPSDTLLPTSTVTEQAKVSQSLQVVLSPEQLAWNMLQDGNHKQYDFATAMHYDIRKPQFVMLHHTSQASMAQTIRTFQLPHTKVSSHYVIGRDGRVVQMLNDYLRGWHAGRGKWGNITDMNSVSIGIELDNSGNEPFPDAQINSLLQLLDTLKTKYAIPQKNFIGHSDFAPGRKDDPSMFFPWERLAERGFGIWFNADHLVPAPANFNPMDALKLMGYDMNNPEAVIRVFKKKFLKRDLPAQLSDQEKAVLYDLYRKFY
ncbi:N-acetylmuramoyl-L-alanine amidase [Sphingobacterium sp. HJSM2_6]|uniref:N-acetylmuramoyl-L-alanine amidase n=1 Tax=Sphingobacterium sp. HJSM2_6 TaxID=3366264 RepID=UPI003BC434B0